MHRGSGHRVTRRRLVAGGATAVLGLAARPAPVAGEASPWLSFVSPPLRRWAQPLPTLARGVLGDALDAAPGRHRFHPELALDTTWGYGGAAFLGPVLEAQADAPATVTSANRLGAHRFADDIDPTVHGAAAVDRTRPRTVLHLHGGLTEPGSDGHPLATTRPGGVRTHAFNHHGQAKTLWYHDHALGITRLNVTAGLAGLCLVRDGFDTGRPDNPLGLPAGERELPLVLQDKAFLANGTLTARTLRVVPRGSWDPGQSGDVAIVNGAAWPRHDVARGLHRLRVLNASNVRTYGLRFSNGMAFWVLGTDQGLLDAPAHADYARVGAGERLDLLVDFSGLAPGEAVRLLNVDRLPFQARLLGDHVLSELVQFRATAGRRGRERVPARLRGGPGLPPPRPAWPRPVRTRAMTLLQVGEPRLPPARLTINNLPFDTVDVDAVRPGTVERWDLLNLTTDEHPVHLHLASMRVLGRRLVSIPRYVAANPHPVLGLRWDHPVAERAFRAPWEPPGVWERGDKDTVYTSPGAVTSVLVRWPGLDELGFDPDAPFPVPATVDAGAPATDDGAASFVCRLSSVVQPAPDRARGYVWHCHVLDHEDHEMMAPLLVRP